jgi:hypothetical protein
VLASARFAWTPFSEPTVVSQLPTEGGAMPLYMDVHSLDGAVTFEDVGKAHQADLKTQGSYDVSYLRYWVDGKHGKIFLPR